MKKKKDDLQVTDEEETKEKKKKTKTVKETVAEWQLINDNKAIWTRNKEDIEDAEYKKFYKALSKDYDDPLSWIHFKAEGEVEFTSLLFIPKRAPHDLFENYYSKSAALKLYVRRVLINEEFEELIPRYLAFIKGVVDSDELPINVSRESIQQLKMLKVIGRKLVRKALEMIKKLAEDEEDDDKDDEESGSDEKSDKEKSGDDKKEEKEEKSDKDDDEEEEDEEAKAKRIQARKDRYKDFWKEYGKNLKLGIIEDSANRQKIAKLSRWHSSLNLTDITSFDEYISRMKTGQESIYVIAGESKESLMNHPTLQKLLKKGYEVLLLDDPIDEFVFQHLTEYEKKKFDNVGKGDFKLPEEDDLERKKVKKLKKMFKPLTEWWKKLLVSEIENVQISQRLVEDPCLVVSTEYGWTANMERISKAQAYANQDRQGPYANSKRILEINPNHPIIKELLDRVKDEADKDSEELARVLYEGALINSGYSIKDPTQFAKRFYRLFHGALGIPRDAPVEEIEVDIDDSGDDEETNQQSSQQPDDVVDLDDKDKDDLNDKDEKVKKDDL